MKINLLAASAFAAALAMPLGVCAQQNQPPPATRADRGTPSEARLQHRWTRRFGNLNLSNDQQQRVQSLIHQYAQSHPEGSPRDRDAARQLHQQLMGVLNNDQQNQYHQQMQAHREQMRQRQGQMQQGPNGQGYQQGPPQGPPQGPQQPPDQQPPDQEPPHD
jgi:Spy/CpxP family protein refolding chaperone